MLKALYYPHTDITNELVLKNALLLWDEIDTIVPRQNWTPSRRQGNKVFNEAVDLIVRPRVPKPSECHEAHRALRELSQTGGLASLLQQSPQEWRGRRFLVYPEKFLDETWHLLEVQGMADWITRAQDYGVPPAVGLLMMSLLADACAGTQLQKLTDRAEAYGWLAGAYARILSRPYVSGLDASQIAPSYDRLVTMTFEALDARSIPLGKLVAMRKRESRQSGADYKAMRRRYLKALQVHIARIGTEARTNEDYRELQYQFKEEIRADVADLKSELKAASLKTLFSSKVAIPAVITAGCLVNPIAGLTTLAATVGAIGIIPLAKAAVEYRGARRDAIKRHVSSWLYLATQGPIHPY